MKPRAILAIICVAALALMAWAAWTDSANYDEVAHIPAGYGYVRYLSYNLMPEHPPFTKALAMIPVALFLHPSFPTQSPAWQSETNAEFEVGQQFLYESGNDADAIIRVARIAPMLITILAIVFVYLLAEMLLGEWWALLPAFLFAFDPTILAHGHYVTTDLAATFGMTAALYYFLRFQAAPSRKNLWMAGIFFGIAELTKFSAVILIPFFFLLLLFRWLLNGDKPKWRALWIFLIGYGLVVYPVYALLVSHYPLVKQVADTQAMFSFLTGAKSALGAFCIWMADTSLLRPIAEYLLGVTVSVSLVNGGAMTGGAVIYAFGKVSQGGGWFYFPVVFLLKETIPALIIFAVAICIMVLRALRPPARSALQRDNEKMFILFALVAFIILYWTICITSRLDLGVRYLTPSFPAIVILAAYFWKRWIRWPHVSKARTKGKYVLLGALLVWLVGESVFSAPYFVSYFNEFAGGVWNGYHVVDDSNYDWKQDMVRLQSWVLVHPGAGKIAVDYFGRSNPLNYYLGDRAVAWSSADGNPAAHNIHWLAVSIDTLEKATQPVAAGVARNASDTYSWLTAIRSLTPDYRVGTSIFIYHL